MATIPQQDNPLIFTASGDQYRFPFRVLAIVWEGSTSQGDTARLTKLNEDGTLGKLLWPGRTNVTNTYQGINCGPKGIHVPFGLQCTGLTAGTQLLVYRLEV